MSDRFARFLVRSQGADLSPHSNFVLKLGAIVDNIRHRSGVCERLYVLCADALETVAEALACLDEVVDAKAQRHRSPKEMAKILRGEDPATAEDFAWLAHREPQAFVVFIRPFLRVAAIGAPQEMAALFAQIIPLIDAQLQKVRSDLAGLDATARRVQGWQSAGQGNAR